MTDGSIANNAKNIMINLKTLSKSIGLAQSNIFRCKSTLKSIEDELVYLTVHNNNTNTNNKDSKKPSGYYRGTDVCQNQYNMVEIEAEPGKSNDYPQSTVLTDYPNKTVKSKSLSKNMSSQNHFCNKTLPKNTNISNVGGELNNLMRAQQRLTCQIEQLKCEIGEKSSTMNSCVKNNQFFNCKLKEIDCDINLLKVDIDKIKRDLTVTFIKSRGYSPYSHDSCADDNGTIPMSVKQSGNRGHLIEHHYGYQDVCTPDNSLMSFPKPKQSKAGSLMLNIKDPRGCSATFEDLMKKNKVDIDCNVNNCRNNQNICEVLNSKQINPVLQDFACLTNQIKNLRRMAENIFNVQNSNNAEKPRINDQSFDQNISTKSIHCQDDINKSAMSKPIAETTLSMFNQSSYRSLLNQVNNTKTELNSECTSISDSDTTCFFNNEDQLSTQNLLRRCSHPKGKSKLENHLTHEELHNYIKRKCYNDNGDHPIHRRQSIPQSKLYQKRFQEQEVNGYCKSDDFCICHFKNETHSNKLICPECNQQLPIIQNEFCT